MSRFETYRESGKLLFNGRSAADVTRSMTK